MATPYSVNSDDINSAIAQQKSGARSFQVVDNEFLTKSNGLVSPAPNSQFGYKKPEYFIDNINSRYTF